MSKTEPNTGVGARGKREHVQESLPSPDANRLLAAKPSGLAMHDVRWLPPAEDKVAAAVAEPQALAGARANLPAEQAGLALGLHEGAP